MPEKLRAQNKQPSNTDITLTPEKLLKGLRGMLEPEVRLNAEERRDIEARIDELEKNMKKGEKTD